MVNISLSRVVKFSEKVPKLIKNEIVVQLVDSFSNPMPLQQLRLKLEIASVNRSGFSSWMFLDNGDGIYTGSYLAEDVGTYEMCVSFDGKYFLHCPFGVNVYSSKLGWFSYYCLLLSVCILKKLKDHTSAFN